jgi:molybdopterin-biosynthesis enzyme MoeA-like protein
MITVTGKGEGAAAGAAAGEWLEPKEEALSEIRAEAERAGRRAESLRRRLAEVESGGASVRRRRGRARGFVVGDGTRIFGIEKAA